MAAIGSVSEAIPDTLLAAENDSVISRLIAASGIHDTRLGKRCRFLGPALQARFGGQADPIEARPALGVAVLRRLGSDDHGCEDLELTDAHECPGSCR